MACLLPWDQARCQARFHVCGNAQSTTAFSAGRAFTGIEYAFSLSSRPPHAPLLLHSTLFHPTPPRTHEHAFPRYLVLAHPLFRYLRCIGTDRRLFLASGSPSFASSDSLVSLSSLVFLLEGKECGPRAPTAAKYATALVVRGPRSYVILLMLSSASISSFRFLRSWDRIFTENRPKSSCVQTLSSGIRMSIHSFSFCMRISSCDADSGLLYS